MVKKKILENILHSYGAPYDGVVDEKHMAMKTTMIRFIFSSLDFIMRLLYQKEQVISIHEIAEHFISISVRCSRVKNFPK